MATVSTEVESCSGFPSDRYDRYVLGLLNAEERAQVDQQVQKLCPTCIKGVQRSMNLWLVYANSLEQKEPAADFRGRLVRIAELSNRVLTIPKRHRRVREPAILISSLVVISLVVLTLMVFTWIAGQQSVLMDRARGNHELQLLTRELSDKQIQLQQQNERIRVLQGRQNSNGESVLARQKNLEDSLSRAQASVQQYKDILSREGEKTATNTLLMSALSNPGVNLLPFKDAKGAPTSSYALMTGTQIIFVSFNLAPLPDGHQYQLWLIRKDSSPPVSAGVFTPGNQKAAVVKYGEDNESISNLSALIVTEEPLNGSSTPTGTRVLETTNLSQ